MTVSRSAGVIVSPMTATSGPRHGNDTRTVLRGSVAPSYSDTGGSSVVATSRKSLIYRRLLGHVGYLIRRSPGGHREICL